MAGPGSGETVLRYHARSTHQPRRYAPGPGFLDWDSQPEPFRTWAGAPRLELPLAGDDLAASWADLHRPGAVPTRKLDRASVGAFLELALGLTAWKEHRGSRWALRANPSSGNLHPTEGYLLLAGTPGVPAGLHHYLSRDHVLEHRWAPSPAAAETLARSLRPGSFLVGLASIHWREAWKYGERAFRYCQHDAGHATGALRYAAAVLGWSARLLEAPGDEDVAALLGLDREGDFAPLAPGDREHPDALVVVGPADGIGEAVRELEGSLDELRRSLTQGAWRGAPNALSPQHVDWPGITEVAGACGKRRTQGADPSSPLLAAAPRGGDRDSSPAPGASPPAVRLIRQRRSAVAMDGRTGLPADTFFRMLERLLARPGVPPWDVLSWPSRVHPVLFVHRVEALAPGLYLLVRAPEAHPALREALRPSFSWARAAGTPDGLPLHLLEEGDVRPFARFASCHQEIASDSAFAVAMLAEAGPALDEGPWWYRRLHWEAGLLGQALYLQAEAAGLRGTGIGCFFDDVVHETLGLATARFRDLYHFTVGGALEDGRLTTRPGYEKAVRRRA